MATIQTKITRPQHPIPRKLNDSMIIALADAFRKGNYQEVACALCGISVPMLIQWLKYGREDFDADVLEEDSLYLRLFNSIKRAEAESEAKIVEVVREAAEIKRDWLSGITFLERRHRERWGRPAPIQVQVSETKEIHITHVEVVEGPRRQEIPPSPDSSSPNPQTPLLPSGEVQSENDDDIPF